MTSSRADMVPLVEKLLMRYGARDPAGLAALFAPDVRWRTAAIPGTPWAERVRNPREVESFFLGLFASFAIDAFTIRRLIINGDDAVVLGRERRQAANTGLTFSHDFALVISARAGLIRECSLFEDSLGMAVALGRADIID